MVASFGFPPFPVLVPKTSSPMASSHSETEPDHPKRAQSTNATHFRSLSLAGPVKSAEEKLDAVQTDNSKSARVLHLEKAVLSAADLRLHHLHLLVSSRFAFDREK